MEQGCLRLGCLWFFIYPLILVLVISGLGSYGLSLGIVGAVLAYTNPAYRDWWKNKRDLHPRLSRLPGMASSSPTTLAIATLSYTVLASVVSWFFLLGTFSQQDTAITTAIMGLGGIVLLVGWLVKGWGIKSPVAQQGSSVIKAQETAYFSRIEQLDEIRELDPVAFERFVGSLFEKMGHEVQTTALSGDEGVDLVLRKDSKLAIAQCKRYQGSVGQPIVRDLYGTMVHNHADEAYLITTGTISLPAQQWAIDKPIHLVDGNVLVEWIETIKEQRLSQKAPISTVDETSSELRIFPDGVFHYLKQNRIALVALLIALMMPLLCFVTGLVAGPIIAPIAATPTPVPVPTLSVR